MLTSRASAGPWEDGADFEELHRARFDSATRWPASLHTQIEAITVPGPNATYLVLAHPTGGRPATTGPAPSDVW